MPKKLIGVVLKLLVTAGLFVLLFRPHTFGLAPNTFGGITPMSLWRELRGAAPASLALWLSFAVVVKLSGMLAGVVRWQLLLRGQGLRIPFWYMVQSWFVGRMFGIFVPGTIGLDGYRFYDSALYTKEPLKSATVIAVEKLIGFISLTFLVFLTFPLGFRLLKIKVAVLAVILCALGIFVVASFLLLLNPRVIQVLVAVTPTPRVIRKKIDKLGAAITAYSGQRPLLLAAVACGLWVHLATCFMFFGTMMSLRAPNTNLLDILFASPIMIYGTVIGPSVGGEGIREIVFGLLLGAKSGVAAAVLFGHLGWWVGDVIPFLIGVPIFLMRSRPGRKELQAELAAAQQAAAQEDAAVHLTPWDVAAYRANLINTVLAGAGAGLIVGACTGIWEAGWIRASFEELTELSAYWWGPTAYGLVFAGLGIGVACGLAFVYLLLDRFASVPLTLGLCYASVAAAGSGIWVWRYFRDVLARHAPSTTQLLSLLSVVIGICLLAGVIAWGIARVFPKGRIKAIVACVAVYGLIVGAGAAYARLNPPPQRHTAFSPQVKASGPNIILIVEDALRADYLSLYTPGAPPKVPNLQGLAQDSVLFDHWFSQASWTKPSFATIFSGRHPESHTATTQFAVLPESVTTFPRLLTEHGYFTKGFANNAFISAAFGFGRGFTDYVDLKPRPRFFAQYSASRLALYEILRHAWETAVSKVSNKIDITLFYQPADVVTREALAWIDGPQRPKDAPFFLFLHYMDTHDPFVDHNRAGVGYARVRNQRPDPAKFLEPIRNAYYSDIEYMDKYVGGLLAGLRDRGLYDDAVILFTADHGEEFQDHGGWWHGQTLFDELIRVPALLKLPKQAKAGAVNSDFARHIDIAPTLLHFAGAAPDAAMQGKSLISDAGAFANQDITFVYAENDFENNVLQAARTRDCKVIRANPDNARNRAPLEVYDVAKDPREQTNVAGQSRPCEAELNKLIGDMIAFIKGGAPEPSKPAAISSQQEDQLKSLGYLGDK